MLKGRMPAVGTVEVSLYCFTPMSCPWMKKLKTQNKRCSFLAKLLYPPSILFSWSDSVCAIFTNCQSQRTMCLFIAGYLIDLTARRGMPGLCQVCWYFEEWSDKRFLIDQIHFWLSVKVAGEVEVQPTEMTELGCTKMAISQLLLRVASSNLVDRKSK